MKIRCLHGHFTISETKVGQVSDFMSLFGTSIVPKGQHFTFEGLEDAPNYTIAGGDLLGFIATKTFEGNPWDVFEANEVVWDFSKGVIVSIQSVVQKIVLKVAGNRFVSEGLILPGSITDEGARVKDYAAWFSRDTQRFSYSEVTYV